MAVNFVDPAELLENKSNGKSILGVAFLLTSFSGEVARDDCPDRNAELSVILPLDGDGDDCRPFLTPSAWNGFRTVVVVPFVNGFVFCTFLTEKSKLKF